MVANNQWKIVWYRKSFFKPIIFLKLFAVWLESNWKQLTWKKINKNIKNVDKMAARMTVYYKEYKKVFSETSYARTRLGLG